jgi:hypothetical protein
MSESSNSLRKAWNFLCDQRGRRAPCLAANLVPWLWLKRRAPFCFGTSAVLSLMVMSRAAAAGGIFSPEQLGILQKIFDQTCADRGFPRDGPQAEDLAAVIVDLFHAGFVGETDLRVALAKKS